MAYESLARRLRAEIDREEGIDRYQDLCLILTHPETKAAILWAGGVWDRTDCRFIDDRDPVAPVVIEVEPSQVAFVSWFAEWLQDFREGRERDVSLVLNAGGRRGGKTWSAVLCQIAALIDVPTIGINRSIGWIISENYKKRQEIEETIGTWIPSKWFHHRKAPEFSYTFANGALLRNLSADDPEDLRQGRVDILTYNEPQQMQAQAIVNGVFGTADKGGLTILAANPPTRTKGEWTIDLKEAIDNGDLKGPSGNPEAVYFFFDPKLNRKIEQASRRRAAKIAQIINPSQVGADDEGAWERLGDRAYPRWTKAFVAPYPGEHLDVTAAVLAKRGHKGYTALGGADFQGYPFNTGVIWRICRINGVLHYWAVDTFYEEGHESNLLQAVRDGGYTERDVLWIGDASGQWQNYKHDKGNRSFAEFKSEGWTIKPPREPQAGSNKHASNPPVENRLRVMARIMSEGRIHVTPDTAVTLADAYRECPLKKVGARVYKTGNHSHVTDAADYPLYWVEPRPTVARKAPRDPRHWLDTAPLRSAPL